MQHSGVLGFVEWEKGNQVSEWLESSDIARQLDVFDVLPGYASEVRSLLRTKSPNQPNAVFYGSFVLVRNK